MSPRAQTKAPRGQKNKVLVMVLTKVLGISRLLLIIDTGINIFAVFNKPYSTVALELPISTVVFWSGITGR